MSRSRLSLFFLLALVSAATLAMPGETTGSGYLVTFTMRGESVTFQTVSEIERYAPPRHGPRPNDWEVRLLGDGGQCLWTGSILNPSLFSPRPPESVGIAILVKTPFLANATALTLHDTAGRERARVPIDERLVTWAKDARAEFLAAAEVNNVAVRARWGAVREKRSEPGPDQRPYFEKIGTSARTALIDSIGKDFERVEAYGVKAVNLSAASGIPIERAIKLVTAPSRKTTSSIQKASLTLSGVVRDTETSLPVAGATLFADQYDADQNYQEDIGSVTTGPDGSYSFGVSEGWVLLSLSEVTGATYASQRIGSR